MKAKPSVLDCYFFPNPSNEIYVVNMLRTCKKTLDVAIFTLTNNKICAAIMEAFNRGVTVRVIADDECCKMWGSDVGILAAAGIPCKTDNAIKYHMHHLYIIKNLPFAKTNELVKDVDLNDMVLMFVSDRLGRGQVEKEKKLSEIEDIQEVIRILEVNYSLDLDEIKEKIQKIKKII